MSKLTQDAAATKPSDETLTDKPAVAAPQSATGFPSASAAPHAARPAAGLAQPHASEAPRPAAGFPQARPQVPQAAGPKPADQKPEAARHDAPKPAAQLAKPQAAKPAGRNPASPKQDAPKPAASKPAAPKPAAPRQAGKPAAAKPAAMKPAVSAERKAARQPAPKAAPKPVAAQPAAPKPAAPKQGAAKAAPQQRPNNTGTAFKAASGPSRFASPPRAEPRQPAQASGFFGAQSVFAMPAQMFDMFLAPWRQLMPSLPALSDAFGASSLPQVEQEHAEREYRYKVSLPGVEPGQIELAVQNRSLVLRVSRQDSRESAGARSAQVSVMRRAIPLPVYTDSSKLTASFRQNVLTIVLPKAERALPAEPRSIAIAK